MGILVGTTGKIFLPCDTIQENDVGPHNKRNSFDSNRNMMGAGFRHNEKSGRKETANITQLVLKIQRNY